MCGIAGEVHFRGPFVPENSAANVRKMCARLIHRGPDEEGLFCSESLAIGIRRLKVIGLVNGSQPVHSHTCVGVFNGEIYNYQQLRRELEHEGYEFRTNTDAEVIVHLYDRDGLSFVENLQGMFAIAIYDKKANRLILVRDRVGKKPLFYYCTPDGSVIFASELGALAQHRAVPKNVLPEAIDRFLSFRIIPAPLTIYKDVYKVRPGEIVVFGEDGKFTRTYFAFDFSEKRPILDKTKPIEELTRRLMESIEARLHSEVPIGAFLSGGLDSSLIVAMTSKIAKQGLNTFSIGFEHRDFNELPYSRIVAEHCGVKHHEYTITAHEALDAFEELLMNFGEPFAFPSMIACYFMSKLARKEVTVVLSGDGADELFCGYSRYKVFDRLPLVGPESLSRIDMDVLLDAGDDVSNLYRAILTDGLRDNLKRRLYSSKFARSLGEEFPRNYLFERFSGSIHFPTRLDRVMAVDCRFWLPDAQMAKVDISSMLHSLEVRCPFLDSSIIEFATRLPVEYKLVNGVEKHILKRVSEKFLPQNITHRAKQELAVPLEDWLMTPLRHTVEATLLSEESLSREYYDPDQLTEFVREWSPRNTYSIWTMYVLERWHRLADKGAWSASHHYSEFIL